MRVIAYYLAICMASAPFSYLASLGIIYAVPVEAWLELNMALIEGYNALGLTGILYRFSWSWTTIFILLFGIPYGAGVVLIWLVLTLRRSPRKSYVQYAAVGIAAFVCLPIGAFLGLGLSRAFLPLLAGWVSFQTESLHLQAALCTLVYGPMVAVPTCILLGTVASRINARVGGSAQFGLKAMLLAPVCVGAVCAAVVLPILRHNEYRRTVRMLEGRGCEMMYLRGSMVSLDATVVMSDGDLPQLERIRTLESLTLDFSDVTDKGMAAIARLPRLKSLSLRQCNVTGSGLPDLRRLATLEELNLHATPLRSSHAMALGSLGGLRRLSVRDTAITNDVVALVLRLPRLESLDLSYCEVRLSSLRADLRTANLRDLALDGCELDAEDIAAVAAVPRLESLSLIDATIETADAALLLTDCRELQSLTWSPHNPEYLRDANRFRKLKKMRLTLCTLDDDEIVNACRIPTLTTLELHSVSCSDEAVEAARRAYPKIKIVRDGIGYGSGEWPRK